jgi:hypothetical protein
VSNLIASPADDVPTNEDTKQDKPRIRSVKKARHDSSPKPVKPTTGSVKKTQHDSSSSVSFIQVCRNYFRCYKDYKFLVNEPLLMNMYESGTAFYAFPGCPDFDIVAAIRYTVYKGDKSTFAFAPLLISVKALDELAPGDASANCSTMEKKLQMSGCDRFII